MSFLASARSLDFTLNERRTTYKERLSISLLWTSPHQFNSSSSFCWLYKNTWSVFLISVSNILNSLHSGYFEHLEKLQKVQDSYSKLVNEIIFHPYSELFSGCLSKDALSTSYQHFVTQWVQVINTLSRIEYKLSTLCLALSTSYQHFVTHWVQVINTLSLLLVWYSPCLSVWSSSCVHSVKTALLLFW